MGRSGTGVRELKKAQTHAAIVHAAMKLFAERGYDETTVEDIASAAGVSPRTFFRYFPSKDAVLFRDHDERVARMKAILAERPAGEPALDSLEAVLLDVASDFADRHEQLVLMAVLCQESADVAARTREQQLEFADVLSAWYAARQPDTNSWDLPVALLGQLGPAAVWAAMVDWTMNGRSAADIPALVAQAIELLRSGLAGL